MSRNEKVIAVLCGLSIALLAYKLMPRKPSTRIKLPDSTWFNSGINYWEGTNQYPIEFQLGSDGNIKWRKVVPLFK